MPPSPQLNDRDQEELPPLSDEGLFLSGSLSECGTG
jgi:hypothetical protein